MSEIELPVPGSALVIVDLQNYYLDPEASYVTYQQSRSGADVLDPIHQRVRELVLPNVGRLLEACRAQKIPVVYLGLAGEKPDRSDLIPVFHQLNVEAEAAGHADFYPLRTEPLAQIAEEISPGKDDHLLWKTSFSGFATAPLDKHLKDLGATTLVVTGICTSLCVENTARDAIDRGYEVIMVEDAQSDFSERRHWLSLESSAHLCGGNVVRTQAILDLLNAPV